MAVLLLLQRHANHCSLHCSSFGQAKKNTHPIHLL